MSPKYLRGRQFSRGFKVTQVNPMELVTAIIHSYTEIEKTIQIEQTKRLEIVAETRQRSQEIRQHIALLRDYMERTFDERRMLFDKLFQQADVAIEKGDNVALAAVMEATKALVEQSPFKDLADLAAVQRGLKEGKVLDL